MRCPTKRASTRKSSSMRSRPRLHPRRARSTARNWTCACRSIARPAATTPSAAGRCSPTNRPSSRCPTVSCAWTTPARSTRTWSRAATWRSRWNPCHSAAYSLKPPSRSSCRRSARPSGRRSSTPTRTARARWSAESSSASIATASMWIWAPMPKASFRARR